LISLKIIANVLWHCTLLAKDAKIQFMPTINQKRFFVSLDELAFFMESDIKYSMIAWASAGHAWKLGLGTTNISGKT